MGYRLGDAGSSIGSEGGSVDGIGIYGDGDGLGRDGRVGGRSGDGSGAGSERLEEPPHQADRCRRRCWKRMGKERKADTPRHRNFLTKSYPVMKKANPETPILIREALDTEPRVWARFGTFPSSDTHYTRNQSGLLTEYRVGKRDGPATQRLEREGNRGEGQRIGQDRIERTRLWIDEAVGGIECTVFLLSEMVCVRALICVCVRLSRWRGRLL